MAQKPREQVETQEQRKTQAETFRMACFNHCSKKALNDQIENEHMPHVLTVLFNILVIFHVHRPYTSC